MSNKNIIQSGIEEIDYDLVASNTHVPTLRLAGKWVYGQNDPWRTAHQFSQIVTDEVVSGGYDSVILVGNGLGYFQVPFPTVVVDPFPSISYKVLPYAKPFISGNIGNKPHIVLHQGYEHVAKFDADRMKCNLYSTGVITPSPHLRDMIFSARAIDALPYITKRGMLQEIGRPFDGKTVCIASGGPSLEFTHHIAEQFGEMTIIAPQALKYFTRNSHVGFICTVDMSADTVDMVKNSRVSYKAILSDLMVNTEILSWPGNTYLFSLLSGHVTDYAWNYQPIFQPFSTVTGVMVFLAGMLGAKKIILLGCDMATKSPDKRYPAEIKVHLNDGTTGFTNSHYLADRHYLDWFARISGIKMVRVGWGATIRNIENLNKFDENIRNELIDLPEAKNKDPRYVESRIKEIMEYSGPRTRINDEEMRKFRIDLRNEMQSLPRNN